MDRNFKFACLLMMIGFAMFVIPPVIVKFSLPRLLAGGGDVRPIFTLLRYASIGASCLLLTAFVLTLISNEKNKLAIAVPGIFAFAICLGVDFIDVIADPAVISNSAYMILLLVARSSLFVSYLFLAKRVGMGARFFGLFGAAYFAITNLLILLGVWGILEVNLAWMQMYSWTEPIAWTFMAVLFAELWFSPSVEKTRRVSGGAGWTFLRIFAYSLFVIGCVSLVLNLRCAEPSLSYSPWQPRQSWNAALVVEGVVNLSCACLLGCIILSQIKVRERLLTLRCHKADVGLGPISLLIVEILSYVASMICLLGAVIVCSDRSIETKMAISLGMSGVTCYGEASKLKMICESFGLSACLGCLLFTAAWLSFGWARFMALLRGNSAIVHALAEPSESESSAADGE